MTVAAVSRDAWVSSHSWASVHHSQARSVGPQAPDSRSPGLHAPCPEQTWVLPVPSWLFSILFSLYQNLGPSPSLYLDKPPLKTPACSCPPRVRLCSSREDGVLPSPPLLTVNVTAVHGQSVLAGVQFFFRTRVHCQGHLECHECLGQAQPAAEAAGCVCSWLPTPGHTQSCTREVRSASFYGQTTLSRAKAKPVEQETKLKRTHFPSTV